jgi:hypothetical protein
MADSQEAQVQETIVLKHRWWWAELWAENRHTFKELIKHVLFFTILIAVLDGFHRLLRFSSLPAEELNLVNAVHFYMYVTALVIFAVTFVIKVCVGEWEGIFRRASR